jgi:hypothetical protein
LLLPAGSNLRRIVGSKKNLGLGGSQEGSKSGSQDGLLDSIAERQAGGRTNSIPQPITLQRKPRKHAIASSHCAMSTCHNLHLFCRAF